MNSGSELKPIPIALEVLPLLAVGFGVGALLFTCWQEPHLCIGASVLGLIWLELSERRLVNDYAWLRLLRELFRRHLAKLGVEDSGEGFDLAAREALMLEHSLGSESVREVVAAAGVRSALAAPMRWALYLCIVASAIRALQ